MMTKYRLTTRIGTQSTVLQYNYNLFEINKFPEYFKGFPKNTHKSISFPMEKFNIGKD